MRRTRLGALVMVLASVVASCTLTTSLDGLAGPPLDPADGALTDGAAPNDADLASEVDAIAASDAPFDAAVTYPSCAAVPPGSPDGFYLIAAGATSFPAYCDMTNDGGGWMLVTAAMLGEETNVQATVSRAQDMHGGLVMTVYVNSQGCASATPRTRHRIFVNDTPAWTHLRYHQEFDGFASCWHIFGGQEGASTLPLDPNLVAFDARVDTIRDQHRMGGSTGDIFDGMNTKCSEDPTNFWAKPNGEDARTATVVLRRRETSMAAGVETGADCGEYAPGASSPLYWVYSSIYVK